MAATALSDLLQKYQPPAPGKHISREFQDYAYRLACQLESPPSPKTVGTCMRLVSKKPRELIESTLRSIIDAPARNRVALFLWKLKHIEAEKKNNATPKQSDLFSE